MTRRPGPDDDGVVIGPVEAALCATVVVGVLIAAAAILWGLLGF